MDNDTPQPTVEPVEAPMTEGKPFPWAEVVSGSMVVVTKMVGRAKERV